MTDPEAPARTVLSLHAILDEATAILDAEGVRGLTFRKLAGRLGTGVASVYWYVTNKDDLVARAADRVISHSLSVLPPDPRRGPRDPVERLRLLAMDLYDQLDAHPWLGPELVRTASQGPESSRLWETIGQQVAALGFPLREQFFYVSALTNFIVGVGAQMATARFRIPQGRTRDEHLTHMADQWAERDPAEFPFTHATLAVMRDHDDRDQFAAGLDLLLSGMAAKRGESGAGRADVVPR